MTRTVNARGDDLVTAVTSAIAELLGCDESDVSVQVPSQRDEVAGRFILELDVHAPRAASPAPSNDANADGEAADPVVTQEELDEEADAAADFLEGLLDALDLPGDIRITLHEDHAEVEIVEIGSGALIGRRGQTLEAIQELVRCALQRQFQRRARVKIDAEGYRARRLEKLLEKAEEAIDGVLESGEAERLEPMDVFERKAVHHLIAEADGVDSHSQGREPARRVVIEPA